MKKPYTQNREVSWIRFNERVLDEAQDKTVMPFEKTKFISIFVSNLTEFFMVRIGSLTDLSILKKDFRDNKTDMTAGEQIDTVLEMLPQLYKKKDELYKAIREELKEYGVIGKSYKELSSDEKKYVINYFHNEFMPLLSPQIIDSSHPFPFLENDRLYVFLSLSMKKKMSYALVPIRNDFPEFIRLKSANSFTFILTWEILLELVEELFHGFTVEYKTIINVTRNFDFSEADADEIRDEFENYKDYMKAVIKRRTRQQAVRLETSQALKGDAEKFLLEKLNLEAKSVFTSESPIRMAYVFTLEKALPSAIKAKICNKTFLPRQIAENEASKMSMIEKKDVMLFYPFDDMKLFLDLIKEAANDKRVFSIKITIYRLAKNSKLVQYLANASENGIDVTVVMELKARFDEENNINYSDVLYNAGCNILFGFEQYKIHSKICLISYRDKNKIKYITQIGTGNYNESTSKQYTDLSLITANEGIGLDANDFFKNIATGQLNGKYANLIQSPSSLKNKILYLMDLEKEKGSEGRIFFKMNSLTDKDIIEKLVECSNAGVKIKMIIRGICCILPKVKSYTENIEIRSIVGRFLEHPRIYVFGKGADALYYISSADFMTRNTERRVEVGVPIHDKTIREKIQKYLDVQMLDNIKGRTMKSNGELKKLPEGDGWLSSQDYCMEKANESCEASKKTRVKSFFARLLECFKN